MLWSAIKPLVSLTGDGELAFTNAYARVLESRYARVTVREILAAESAIIATRFGGNIHCRGRVFQHMRQRGGQRRFIGHGHSGRRRQRSAEYEPDG